MQHTTVCNKTAEKRASVQKKAHLFELPKVCIQFSHFPHEPACVTLALKPRNLRKSAIRESLFLTEIIQTLTKIIQTLVGIHQQVNNQALCLEQE